MAHGVYILKLKYQHCCVPKQWATSFFFLKHFCVSMCVLSDFIMLTFSLPFIHCNITQEGCSIQHIVALLNTVKPVLHGPSLTGDILSSWQRRPLMTARVAWEPSKLIFLSRKLGKNIY